MAEPRVGIWLMPNNKVPGELEEFVASMIPDGDPVWPLAKDYVDRIPTKHRKFSDRKILRAKVHSWLATRTEPRKMGAAIAGRRSQRRGTGRGSTLGVVATALWLRGRHTVCHLRGLTEFFQFLDAARPVGLEQPGEGAVGKQFAAGLATRAVVALVVRVDDALHQGRAHRAGLPVLAVHRHPRVERGHLLRKRCPTLRAQELDPLAEHVATTHALPTPENRRGSASARGAARRPAAPSGAG